MGEVFIARRGDERVALKTLQRASSTNLLRFKNEFRALADVRHPNLVELYALGAADGRNFLTMELIEDAVPFATWVRRGAQPGERPDLDRLEGALVQLGLGLSEIHHHGYVHRDLKPSNVLVTTSGRVVLLDFGLISAADGRQQALTRDGQILGTPSYMAPEQAVGLSVGPPADIYAVGVMLYECLTGRLPIEGAPLEVLAEKLRTLDADTALTLIPPRWRELCGSMLQRDPQLRPSITDVLASLKYAKERGEHRQAAPFVGRVEELEYLRAARAGLDEGDEPRVVLLRGPSGQGKSMLLQRCIAELKDEGYMVLSGRCREQESVPYKGVDAVVDALALHLRRLSAPDRTSLRPRSIWALTRMFPVLDELWPDAEAEHLEPTELRGVAWTSLYEVIDGLTQRGLLALTIDDAQWSDLDSVQLLETLLDAQKPPALLLVLVLRDDLGPLDALQAITSSPVIGPSVARVLELGPLPEADAHALVMHYGEAREVPRASDPRHAALWAESIVLRAKGSPFFITQLALGPQDSDQSVEELDRLVERRLARLDPPAHQLLAVISVAGGPLSKTLAMAMVSDADAGTLQFLREQALIVESSRDGRRDALVETAHDRVREVMLDVLDPTARAGLHTALGEELLARHEDGDGLFRAIDQLDAGLIDTNEAALDDQRRRQLAELNCRAGARARDAAAWVPASRYFGVAARLIEPWITRAQTEGNHHRLCVDVMYGEAEACRMNEDDRWFTCTEALLRWSLSDADYGRTLKLQMEGLNLWGRHEEALERGIAGLERLGVRVPRSPSALLALLSGLRAWWAIRRIDRPALLAMPAVPSESTRAAMSIMSEVSSAAFNIEPNLGLWLLSRNVIMTKRYGYYDRTLPTLACFGVFFIAMFDVARATRLFNACVAVARPRMVGARDMAIVQSLAQFFLFSRVRPLRGLAAAFERSHRRCVELGSRREAEFSAWLALTTMMDGGIHRLPELVKLNASWRTESRLCDLSGIARATDHTVRYCEVFIDGPAKRSFPGHEGMTDSVRGHGIVREMMAMTHFGDHSNVLAVFARAERSILQMLSKTYLFALIALSVSIAIAECIPSAPVIERYRMRRRMRHYRRILRRWAAAVPENYGPMLDIVEAERACLVGRFDRATTHYERAVEAATNSGMVWLAGLAADRLARHADRHGHAILWQAALARSRSLYDQWGAAALVRRADAICAASPMMDPSTRPPSESSISGHSLKLAEQSR